MGLFAAKVVASDYFCVYDLFHTTWISACVVRIELENGIDSTKIELIESRIESNWIDYRIKKIESITRAKIHNSDPNYELVNLVILNAWYFQAAL